jgi:creatinine amidohydrolase/Fe(II)-dependent formamide hydrolase-like protein
MFDPKSRRYFMKTLGASGAVFAMNSGNAESGEMNTDGQHNPHQTVNVSDINPGKVLLTELTRKEVREWFDTGGLKAAIIPTGSTEQHNEHMALSMDTEASMVISQLTALKLFPKVIVTTPVAFGICPFFMKRRGTITIREEIFVGLVYDICCSMKTGHADEFETSFALAAFPEKIRRVSYNEEELYNWNPDQKDLDRVGYFDARWFSKEFDKSSFEESLLATAEKGERFISHAVEWTAEKLLTMMG